MAKLARLLVIALSLSLPAFAGAPCPVTLLSGAGDASSISIVFQNVGKLPIRRLEFNCVTVHQHARKAQDASCRETNALFFPGMEYTVSYPYPGGIPEQVLVSVKSATLSDGYVWKPSQHQDCGVLTIHPARK